jgi:hypothetical protein
LRFFRQNPSSLPVSFPPASLRHAGQCTFPLLAESRRMGVALSALLTSSQ